MRDGESNLKNHTELQAPFQVYVHVYIKYVLHHHHQPLQHGDERLSFSDPKKIFY